MSVLDQLAGHVTRNIQNRGRDYFRRGAVTLYFASRDTIEAEVEGTSDYNVLLRRVDGGIEVSCTCAYYEEQLVPCKHVWATLLAADNQGRLGAWRDGRPLVLQPADEAVVEDDVDLDADGAPGGATIYRFPVGGAAAAGHRNGWREKLEHLETKSADLRETEGFGADRQVLYIFDAEATLAGRGLVLEIAARRRLRTGEWGKTRAQGIRQSQIAELPDPADQEALMALLGAPRDTYQYARYEFQTPNRFQITPPMFRGVVPLLASTGRCFLRMSGDAELLPLVWDPGKPWEFWVEARHSTPASEYVLTGSLRRDGERIELPVPVMLVRGGLVFSRESIAVFDDFGAFDWIVLLRREKAISIPAADRDALVASLTAIPFLPRLDLPEDLRFEEVSLSPRFHLGVSSGGPGRDLTATLQFEYDSARIPEGHASLVLPDPSHGRRIVRDRAAERSAIDRLDRLGLRTSRRGDGRSVRRVLAARQLAPVVQELVRDGWRIEAEGKPFRRPGRVRLEVAGGTRTGGSGVDWFELRGTLDFEGHGAPFPRLLEALARGERTVVLDDGTLGMIPDEWLKRYGLLAGLGSAEGESVRFARSQIGLLDALLAEQPDIEADSVFTGAREELRAFEGVRPVDPPPGFVGELRGYQRAGLGWMEFLRRFGFGGCLADDMGLGKTVQVLAVLEGRRALRETGGDDRPAPSLVVVPKSLIFNWKLEATRFAPRLRVLDHTGVGRARGAEHFDDFDIILTTYGTLRRDAAQLRAFEFDYVILDEAQAVKNSTTESAKAVRLLRGRHRLALSGTPVENHLGELWSLFEFLNPGMLGTASVFRMAEGDLRAPESAGRGLLARALRPFVLRRTKEQVARDLPPRLEQTLYCELEGAQRTMYDELRDHYRRTLLGSVDSLGIARSKLQILEALLRLRQAACHPGLIDRSRSGEPSTKLDLLIPQLEEVLDEGHKALVFSQFTSMLAIVRTRLDAAGIPYEYLDGRTRDRAERVAHFQTDPGCKLFLISLRAGGLGLNLTAAEYVFLLDPWWNPAVEMQAIDRTHRIGQTRPVFAYRLIARDTVEEKVLELQQTKRALADAILGSDNSLIRDLSREDLELLLG